MFKFIRRLITRLEHKVNSILSFIFRAMNGHLPGLKQGPHAHSRQHVTKDGTKQKNTKCQKHI